MNQVSLSMDFGFNCLRDVKKVNWEADKEKEVPWWCEVRDGLSWFGYCKNKECKAYR